MSVNAILTGQEKSYTKAEENALLATKQATLTFDNTPTANSNNPVTSQGIKTAIDTKVPVQGLGKNLLVNWYFVGGGSQQGGGQFPINSRGLTTYTTAMQGYCIDCWTVGASTYGTRELVNNGIEITGVSNFHQINQYFDTITTAYLLNKTITLSALFSTGKLFTVTDVLTTTGKSVAITNNNNNEVGLLGFNVDSGMLRVYIRANVAKSIICSAVKLELGTEQTLCYNKGTGWVLNEVPDYQEELTKCKIHEDNNDSYANKSLATEQQIAYVENGLTASKAYAIGDYFCWNGLLYKAKTAIQSGASFTNGTNCESIVLGDELNSRAPIKMTKTTIEVGHNETLQLSPSTGYLMLILSGAANNNAACYSMYVRYNGDIRMNTIYINSATTPPATVTVGNSQITISVASDRTSVLVELIQF